MTGSSSDRFLTLPRGAWAEFGQDEHVTLGDEELRAVEGINEPLSQQEQHDVYLPLSRLVKLHFDANATLASQTRARVGLQYAPIPFVIGVAGSVAVGKSTTTRLLQSLIALWPEQPVVAVVPTDGFLYPNAKLRERNMLERKGFPESYDRHRLLAFMEELKAGGERLELPVYSHLEYDIVPEQTHVLERADVVIVEGVNVLQPWHDRPPRPSLFVSDLFDLALYIDAEEADIRQWHLRRFQALCETVFTEPRSYFHRYAGLSAAEAQVIAERIWKVTNGPNLRANIAPTRSRADVILRKSADHSVGEVRLRKI